MSDTPQERVKKLADALLASDAVIVQQNVAPDGGQKMNALWPLVPAAQVAVDRLAIVVQKPQGEVLKLDLTEAETDLLAALVTFITSQRDVAAEPQPHIPGIIGSEV